jgi:hypothetical protein
VQLGSEILFWEDEAAWGGMARGPNLRKTYWPRMDADKTAVRWRLIGQRCARLCFAGVKMFFLADETNFE